MEGTIEACGDGSSRVFLVAQRDSTDNLAVGGSEDIHDFLAMRFNELSVDIVRADRMERSFLWTCAHRPDSRLP